MGGHTTSSLGNCLVMAKSFRSLSALRTLSLHSLAICNETVQTSISVWINIRALMDQYQRTSGSIIISASMDQYQRISGSISVHQWINISISVDQYQCINGSILAYQWINISASLNQYQQISGSISVHHLDYQ